MYFCIGARVRTSWTLGNATRRNVAEDHRLPRMGCDGLVLQLLCYYFNISEYAECVGVSRVGPDIVGALVCYTPALWALKGFSLCRGDACCSQGESPPDPFSHALSCAADRCYTSGFVIVIVWRWVEWARIDACVNASSRPELALCPLRRSTAISSQQLFMRLFPLILSWFCRFITYRKYCQCINIRLCYYLRINIGHLNILSQIFGRSTYALIWALQFFVVPRHFRLDL